MLAVLCTVQIVFAILSAISSCFSSRKQEDVGGHGKYASSGSSGAGGLTTIGAILGLCACKFNNDKLLLACVVLAWITIGFLILAVVCIIMCTCCAAALGCCKKGDAETGNADAGLGGLGGCAACCAGGCALICMLIVFGIMAVFPILNLVFAWPFL